MEERLTKEDLERSVIFQEKFYKEKELFNNFAKTQPYVNNSSIGKQGENLIYYMTFQNNIENSVIKFKTFQKETSSPANYEEVYKELLREFFKDSENTDEKYQNDILFYLSTIMCKNVIPVEDVQKLVDHQYRIFEQLSEDYKVFESYIDSL